MGTPTRTGGLLATPKGDPSILGLAGMRNAIAALDTCLETITDCALLDTQYEYVERALIKTRGRLMDELAAAERKLMTPPAQLIKRARVGWNRPGAWGHWRAHTMIPHNNHSPSDPVVKAWNDSRPSRRPVLPAPRPTSDPLRLFVRFLLIVCILFGLVLLAPPAGAAARPPRPCVGVVIRTIEGVEYVRRRDGTACTRPAPHVVRRAR